MCVCVWKKNNQSIEKWTNQYIVAFSLYLCNLSAHHGFVTGVDRPTDKSGIAEYVTSNFSGEEMRTLTAALDVFANMALGQVQTMGQKL